MLVLTRKLNEQIRIGDDVVITVLQFRGSSIRIGIEAPQNVRVLRGELPIGKPQKTVVDVVLSDASGNDLSQNQPTRVEVIRMDRRQSPRVTSEQAVERNQPRNATCHAGTGNSAALPRMPLAKKVAARRHESATAPQAMSGQEGTPPNAEDDLCIEPFADAELHLALSV